MDWTPTLSDTAAPVFMRIVDALAEDVASGRLGRGQQLPTHRALAKTLDLDLTTVTRAYGEARRRGLIDAQVGRGTFVSETTARAAHDMPAQVKINLSMIIPPQPVEAGLDGHIARGLKAIQEQYGFSAFLNYQKPGGSDNERETAARWLRPRVRPARADRLVIYPGNQAILFNALLALTSPGDAILTESVTFPGIKAAADKLGVRLVGVAMDDQGVLPDAFAASCKKHRPKAVYLMPTLHNPTTATMRPERRKAIAGLIRDHDTILIEDDAYGCLVPSIAPLANLIPERTYLAVGLAKCIAPALRVSYLLVPDDAAAQIMRANLQATMLMPAQLMVALVTHWLHTGTADKIITAIRNEAAARQQLAHRVLRGIAFAGQPHAHHIWMPLPQRWSRSDFLAHMQNRGLAIVGDDAFTVDGSTSLPAVRISLGAARHRAELAQALQFIADTLRSSTRSAQIV